LLRISKISLCKSSLHPIFVVSYFKFGLSSSNFGHGRGIAGLSHRTISGGEGLIAKDFEIADVSMERLVIGGGASDGPCGALL
jgi:hypothetical protein